MIGMSSSLAMLLIEQEIVGNFLFAVAVVVTRRHQLG